MGSSSSMFKWCKKTCNLLLLHVFLRKLLSLVLYYLIVDVEFGNVRVLLSLLWNTDIGASHIRRMYFAAVVCACPVAHIPDVFTFSVSMSYDVVLI